MFALSAGVGRLKRWRWESLYSSLPQMLTHIDESTDEESGSESSAKPLHRSPSARSAGLSAASPVQPPSARAGDPARKPLGERQQQQGHAYTGAGTPMRISPHLHLAQASGSFSLRCLLSEVRLSFCLRQLQETEHPRAPQAPKSHAPTLAAG